MKKISLLIAAVLFFATLHAQDIITLKNGTQLRGTVTDVNLNSIKYQKAGADTTTYTVPKSEVLVVDYKDGSTLVLNTLTPADQTKVSENFPQRLFIDVGGCLEYQFPQNYIYKAKLNFYPNISLGITVSRRVTFDLETNYQVLSFSYSRYSYLPPGTKNYSYNSFNSNNTNMYLAPNIIITANQHKFTPYARMGAMIGILNRTDYSENYVYSNNGIVTNNTYEGSTGNLINVGVLLAGGSTWQLTKHISVFGELYVRGILPTSSTSGLLLEVNAPAVGLNAGLKFIL